MELLFIHSILEHNYTALLYKFIVVGICWLLAILALIVDLIVGLRKAKELGEVRTSYGLERTATKFIMRFAFLILGLCADFLFLYIINSFSNFIPAIPYVTIGVTIFIIIIEGRSVGEKGDEKARRRIKNDVTQAAELLLKLKDKEEVLDLLSDLINKSKQ
ncbi:hypothetical protein LJB95_03195 [Paludibacteraceae bacterium OttesenSCG-928-F17]|nr:hypothetical protein [Paludibacteraceae bacterium OttesenSCG-928-F17]